jgi:integrase
VLTASRLSEATGADWSEIDGNVWTIPADRYKTGKVAKVRRLGLFEFPRAVGVLTQRAALARGLARRGIADDHS